MARLSKAALNIRLRLSKASMKMRGDNGHPWRTERVSLKDCADLPLIIIVEDADLKLALKEARKHHSFFLSVIGE